MENNYTGEKKKDWKNDLEYIVSLCIAAVVK